MKKTYDAISLLMNYGINTPFTASDAIEFIGNAVGFHKMRFITPQSIRTQLPRDSRVVRVGTRRGDALYDWVLNVTK